MSRFRRSPNQVEQVRRQQDDTEILKRRRPQSAGDDLARRQPAVGGDPCECAVLLDGQATPGIITPGFFDAVDLSAGSPIQNGGTFNGDGTVSCSGWVRATYTVHITPNNGHDMFVTAGIQVDSTTKVRLGTAGAPAGPGAAWTGTAIATGPLYVQSLLRPFFILTALDSDPAGEAFVVVEFDVHEVAGGCCFGDPGYPPLS